MRGNVNESKNEAYSQKQKGVHKILQDNGKIDALVTEYLENVTVADYGADNKHRKGSIY